MNKSLIALLLLGAVSSVAGWINGLNMPWNKCGNDFGVGYSSSVFSEAFGKYH